MADLIDLESRLLKAMLSPKKFAPQSSTSHRIRAILEQYPEFSVLNELLQNADDAKATKIQFLFDKRTVKAMPLGAHGFIDSPSGNELLVVSTSISIVDLFARLMENCRDPH